MDWKGVRRWQELRVERPIENKKREDKSWVKCQFRDLATTRSGLYLVHLWVTHGFLNSCYLYLYIFFLILFYSRANNPLFSFTHFARIALFVPCFKQTTGIISSTSAPRKISANHRKVNPFSFMDIFFFFLRFCLHT